MQKRLSRGRRVPSKATNECNLRLAKSLGRLNSVDWLGLLARNAGLVILPHPTNQGSFILTLQPVFYDQHGAPLYDSITQAQEFPTALDAAKAGLRKLSYHHELQEALQTIDGLIGAIKQLTGVNLEYRREEWDNLVEEGQIDYIVRRVQQERLWQQEPVDANDEEYEGGFCE